eukprot:5572357-Amphidinium_carterae.1
MRTWTVPPKAAQTQFRKVDFEWNQVATNLNGLACGHKHCELVVCTVQQVRAVDSIGLGSAGSLESVSVADLMLIEVVWSFHFGER